MNQKEYKANIAYLETKEIHYHGKAWNDKPWSAELTCSTDAGGDMVINLEVLDPEHFYEYIDDFDIDEEIMLWWQSGKEAARQKGLPFDNIGDHYRDLQEWLDYLRAALEDWPGQTIVAKKPKNIVIPKDPEIVEVFLSEAAYPAAYKAKMEELMEQHAFKSEDEARAWLRQNPIQLELIYEKHSGLFAVESEALASNTLKSPYSGNDLITEN